MARTINLLGMTLWPSRAARLLDLEARVLAAENSIATTTGHVLPALNERIAQVDRAAGNVITALETRVAEMEGQLSLLRQRTPAPSKIVKAGKRKPARPQRPRR
ncbi:MAG TPA: hypothetical protein VES70_27785 [Pseudomonas sp.]|nr:hypothetical protein [Pseudomonas sp.]